MSREHGPLHEELLAALLAGEGDREELRRRIEGCEVCARRLDELGPIAELLAVTAGVENLGADALPPFEAGEQAARRRLRALAAGAEPTTSAPKRRPRGGLLLLGLAAAGLSFLLLRTLGGAGETPGHGDVFLSGETLELLAPASEGVAADELAFAWTGALEPGEVFVLRIQDEAGSTLLDAPLRLHEARWSPAPELVAAWPELVLVQVAQEDAFGEESRHSAWKRVRLER